MPVQSGQNGYPKLRWLVGASLVPLARRRVDLSKLHKTHAGFVCIGIGTDRPFVFILVIRIILALVPIILTVVVLLQAAGQVRS